MPKPLDRATFLRQVGDSVDLQPADVGEVLEELNSHLSDAAAGWREAGYDFEDAEQRALRGLGDPARLGRELGRARHQRRHLLAAVGGAVFHTFAFGIWAYLTLWVVVGGLAVIGGCLSWWVLSTMGGSASGWFTGPIASLGTILITALWFAWVGWVLPWRVARSGRRSVVGVQRAVGLVGFAIAVVALWCWPQLDMDPVLAVGLPLAPVAYLVASQRPNRRPSLFPDTTRRLRAGIAVSVVLGTALVGLITVNTSWNGGMGGGWVPGLERLGSDPSTDPVLAPLLLSTSISAENGAGADATTSASFAVAGLTFGEAGDQRIFEQHIAALTLEIVPASIDLPTSAGPGLITLHEDPIASATAALPVADLGSAVRVQLPSLRTATQTVMVLTGHRQDGSSVILGFDTYKTPAWHGTLFDWWFTGR